MDMEDYVYTEDIKEFIRLLKKEMPSLKIYQDKIESAYDNYHQ